MADVACTDEDHSAGCRSAGLLTSGEVRVDEHVCYAGHWLECLVMDEHRAAAEVPYEPLGFLAASCP